MVQKNVIFIKWTKWTNIRTKMDFVHLVSFFYLCLQNPIHE